MIAMTITEFARKGGNAVYKKYGSKYMKTLQKKSAKARKSKKRKAVDNSA